MAEYYNAGNRQLQDEFDTRRLADRLQAGIIAPVITPEDAKFIEAQNMFFLATVDDKGQANCSYKGGSAGLVKVVVRVKVRETFPNCPRYIHKMALVEESTFVPKATCETPAALWKKLGIVADVLPACDAHLASNEEDVLAAINRD